MNGIEIMDSPIPILLTAEPSSAKHEQLRLPPIQRNLFVRLIRNPRPRNRLPRESECTEMFVSVLLNTPRLRVKILEFLAGLVSDTVPDFTALRLDIDTEQYMDGKRDDIRIYAWNSNESEEIPDLLWTVEVKVSAGFHYSSTLVDDDDTVVHQIQNYDYWLAQQEAKAKAGFVLALSDMTQHLPADLCQPWSCTTWTHIAQVVESELRIGELEEVERFLAQHFLGFVYRYLVDTTGDSMNDFESKQLSFDDVALIRAFDSIGNRCRKAVEQLVAPLVTVLEDAALFSGEIKVQRNLFGGHHRQCVYQGVIGPPPNAMPYLFAGISTGGEASVIVWLETSPNHPLKSEIREVIQQFSPRLQARDPNWYIVPPEPGGWHDVSISAPLERLLVAEDQSQYLNNFVSNALEDLKSTGAADALINVANRDQQ